MTPRLYSWRRAIFRFGIWNVIYRFWSRIHVYGWHNIPSSGPVVMMGNHINALDPVVMISFYPDRDIIPLAKIEAFEQPFMRYFVRHWGAIPVNRGEADISALKSVFHHLDQNHIIMLYAEGTRSKTGLIQGQDGGAFIASRTDATIVPVAIWGTDGFPFAWFRDFSLMDIHISFGRPFKLRVMNPRTAREQFRAMTDEIMYQIALLLPKQWRGIYDDVASMSAHYLDFDISWTPPQRVLPSNAIVHEPCAALEASKS